MCKRGILALMFLFFFPLMVEAGTTYIATTAGEIQSYTNMLEAGDTLLVQTGEYDLNWKIAYLGGTSSDWIVIAGMGGDVVIRCTVYDNVVEVTNCNYVYLKGFEITSTNTALGIDGIKFKDVSDHVTIENCHIHDVTGVGIPANADDIGYLTVRRCHIHDVSEGIYLGTQDGSIAAHHCVIEWNWIHDTHPDKGIQIKRNCYLNTIQDNVLYNNDVGGVVVYKTGRSSSADNNIVRRNVIWNAGEGIFAVGQTNIENNIIFNCDYGINTRNYSNWGMEDLYIRNNTVYNCNTTCLMLSNWDMATGQMICINNAFYQDLLSQNAILAPNGVGPGEVEHNRHYGSCGVSGSVLGNSPDQEFINPSVVPGAVDLYPEDNSTLRNAGIATFGVPNEDFNLLGRPVNEYWDIGAYEWSQSGNPGWQIQPGFKGGSIVQVEESDASALARPYMSHIYPNPFGSHTTMRYFLTKGAPVVLKVYNIRGQLVKTLLDEIQTDGEHMIQWNGKNEAGRAVAGGMYFFRLKAGQLVETRKVILLK
jgi:hypothetical protein